MGCIYSQGLLVLDASEAEISAAVADVAQTFTGTGGIFATDLVDLASFDVASVTGSVDLATVVNGAAGAGGAAGATDAVKTTSAAAAATSAAECLAEPPTTAAAGATDAVVASSTSAAAAAQTSAAASSGGTNIQAFTGTLGGPAPPVESSTGDRPFSVNGNTFTGSGAALGRSCDIQHNACADAANSGQLAGGVAQCEQQVADCRAANSL